MIPAVFLVYSQDELLAYVAGEVEVDIGDAGQGVFGQETLDGEVVFEGVYMGEADEIAHQHGDAGATATARRGFLNGHFGVHQPQFHLYLPGHADDVVVQEEEACEVVPVDEAELFFQTALDPSSDGAVAAHGCLAT